MSAADLQRIQVKVLFERTEGFSPVPFIAIFDTWRLQDATSWIDFADYGHLPDGPLVSLIGFERHVTIDVSDGVAGLLLSWRRGLAGSHEERFARVVREAFAIAARLLGNPRCPPGLARSMPVLEVGVNDRLDFPDDEDTEARLGAPLRAALDGVLGAGGYSLERLKGSTRRYVYRAVASRRA